MYNKIILAGNLTRDIEVRYTHSCAAICNTDISTSRKFKTQSVEQKEDTLFVDITFFGRTAEIANQYLRKGSKVLVDGRLKLDQWTAQDGSKRSKHSVTVESLQMLGSKDEAAPMGGNGYSQQGGSSYDAPAQNNYSQPAPSAPAAAPQPTSNLPEIDINEDEIPF